MKQSLLRALVAAITLAAASSGTLAYDRLVVLGDSLSDSGNNAIALGGSQPNQVITGNTYVPSHPYAGNTYSNAGVWVQSFAAALNLPSGAVPSLIPGGSNFAFGGARTVLNGANPQNFPYSATTQLGMYLGQAPTITADSLFVVAVGGNDVRATAEAALADPGNAAAIVNSAAGNFAAGVDGIVDGLQAAGAANPNIVFWTAPDVGKTPAALALGPAAAGYISLISVAFNQALAVALADDVAQGVKFFDVFANTNGIVAAPGVFGLSNVTDACGALGAACDPSTYLFWDGIHPTSAGHALIASAMLQVVAVPEPASVLMMAIGLAGLLVVRRRRA